jgi:hypothetical protein
MRLIEGSEGRKIPELKRRACGVLSDEAWKVQRDRLLDTLNEANADADLRLRALREHDQSRGTISPLVMSLFTIEGCLKVIDTACKEAGMSAVEFCGDLSQARLEQIAMDLIGIVMRDRVGETTTGTATLQPSR